MTATINTAKARIVNTQRIHRGGLRMLSTSGSDGYGVMASAELVVDLAAGLAGDREPGRSRRARAAPLPQAARRRQDAVWRAVCRGSLDAHEPGDAGEAEDGGHVEVQPQPEEVVGGVDAQRLLADPREAE